MIKSPSEKTKLPYTKEQRTADPDLNSEQRKFLTELCEDKDFSDRNIQIMFKYRTKILVGLSVIQKLKSETDLTRTQKSAAVKVKLPPPNRQSSAAIKYGKDPNTTPSKVSIQSAERATKRFTE